MVHGGLEGVWYPLDMARAFQADAEELVERRFQIEDLKKRLAIKDLRIGAYKEALGFEMQAMEKALSALQASEERAQTAEARQDAWYRSPALWVTVGVVLTVVVEVAAVKTFTALQ